MLAPDLHHVARQVQEPGPVHIGAQGGVAGTRGHPGVEPETGCGRAVEVEVRIGLEEKGTALFADGEAAAQDMRGAEGVQRNVVLLILLCSGADLASVIAPPCWCIPSAKMSLAMPRPSGTPPTGS
jgi:hypothetical protein